jgi:hypothetical protein
MSMHPKRPRRRQCRLERQPADIFRATISARVSLRQGRVLCKVEAPPRRCSSELRASRRKPNGAGISVYRSASVGFSEDVTNNSVFVKLLT